MSRRVKTKNNNKYSDNANTKKLAPHEKPPNYPQENILEHRVFLARSLRRNDEDMSVLVDLNRTLHQVRENIIKTIGEEFLLDLGEGLFQLTPDERDLMVKPPEDEYEMEHSPQRKILQEKLDNLEEEQRLLCVDFLLRMKLRRRMLNRLARRLMRVAHAMDGEDVSPPVPPKYGDLRLHVDPEEIKLAKKQWQLQMEANERVTAFRLEHPESLVPLIKLEGEDDEEQTDEKDSEDKPLNGKREVGDGFEEEKSEMNSTGERKEDFVEEADETDKDGDVEMADDDAEKPETAKSETGAEAIAEVKAEGQEPKTEEAAEPIKKEVDTVKADTDEATADKPTDEKKDSEVLQEENAERKEDDGSSKPIRDDDTEAVVKKEGKTAAETASEVADKKPEDTSNKGAEDAAAAEKSIVKEDDDKASADKPKETTDAKKEEVGEGTEENGKDEAEQASSDEPSGKEEATESAKVEDTKGKTKAEEGQNGSKDVEMEDATGEDQEDSTIRDDGEDSKAATAPSSSEIASSKEEKMDDAKEKAEQEDKSETKKAKEGTEKEDGSEKEHKMDVEEEETTTEKPDDQPTRKEEAYVTVNQDKTDSTGAKVKTEDEKSGDDVLVPGGRDGKNDLDAAAEKIKTEKKEPGDEDSNAGDDKTATEIVEKSGEVKVKSEAVDGSDDETTESKDGKARPKPDEPASIPVKKSGQERDEEMVETPGRKLLIELPPPRELSQLEKDQEILKEFVDAYTKEVDPITGDVSFQILNEEREEDYAAIQSGFGVGAVNKQMSLKEKEVEFRRWQASLLGRIPEAPTFEEIGMKNNVFLLQERRNCLKRKREEEENSNKRLRSSSVEEEGSKAKKGRNIGAVERKSPAKKSKDSDEDEEKKDVTKRMKPLSLVPIPSFHESDLRRIRMVHFDLMTASIQGGAKARFEAAQDEYNAAFRNSNAILDRKVSFENSLQQQISHYEAQFKKLIENYRRSITMERAQWKQQKAEYDANRLKKLMPSNWNSQPYGTQVTQAVVNKYREGTVANVVGNCMADIVDVVIMKITDPRINDQPFQEFQPSKPEPTPDTIIADQSTGETLRQKIDRIQVQHRREIEAAKANLAQAEEERKRAWKKMEKTKAEYHQMLSAQSSSYASSAAMASSGSSYTPGRRRDLGAYQSNNVSASDSKYSVARIRERQLPDGCVEPISKKKGADGFYQRPAGRARKDMQWNAVRGVWVPTGSGQY